MTHEPARFVAYPTSPTLDHEVQVAGVGGEDAALVGVEVAALAGRLLRRDVHHGIGPRGEHGHHVGRAVGTDGGEP